MLGLGDIVSNMLVSVVAIFVKSSSHAAVLLFKELLFQFSTQNFLMKPLLCSN